MVDDYKSFVLNIYLGVLVYLHFMKVLSNKRLKRFKLLVFHGLTFPSDYQLFHVTFDAP